MFVSRLVAGWGWGGRLGLIYKKGEKNSRGGQTEFSGLVSAGVSAERRWLQSRGCSLGRRPDGAAASLGRRPSTPCILYPLSSILYPLPYILHPPSSTLQQDDPTSKPTPRSFGVGEPTRERFYLGVIVV